MQDCFQKPSYNPFSCARLQILHPFGVVVHRTGFREFSKERSEANWDDDEVQGVLSGVIENRRKETAPQELDLL